VSDMTSPKGFLASLFDYSFSSFITTRIIKILYVLITIVYSLVALAFLAIGISHGPGPAVAAIIFVPIAWLLYMIFARVALEVLIVVFRIGEDIHLVAHPGGGAPPSGLSPQQGFGGPAPSAPNPTFGGPATGGGPTIGEPPPQVGETASRLPPPADSSGFAPPPR